MINIYIYILTTLMSTEFLSSRININGLKIELYTFNIIDLSVRKI